MIGQYTVRNGKCFLVSTRVINKPIVNGRLSSIFSGTRAVVAAQCSDGSIKAYYNHSDGGALLPSLTSVSQSDVDSGYLENITQDDSPTVLGSFDDIKKLTWGQEYVYVFDGSQWKKYSWKEFKGGRTSYAPMGPPAPRKRKTANAHVGGRGELSPQEYEDEVQFLCELLRDRFGYDSLESLKGDYTRYSLAHEIFEWCFAHELFGFTEGDDASRSKKDIASVLSYAVADDIIKKYSSGF